MSIKVNVNESLLNCQTGEVMKVRKQETITLANGQQAVRTVDTDKDVTFKGVVSTCLWSKKPEEKEKKSDLHALAMLVNDSEGELELTETQASLIRDTVNEFEETMVYGQIDTILKKGYQV